MFLIWLHVFVSTTDQLWRKAPRCSLQPFVYPRGAAVSNKSPIKAASPGASRLSSRQTSPRLDGSSRGAAVLRTPFGAGHLAWRGQNPAEGHISGPGGGHCPEMLSQGSRSRERGRGRSWGGSGCEPPGGSVRGEPRALSAVLPGRCRRVERVKKKRGGQQI